MLQKQGACEGPACSEQQPTGRQPCRAAPPVCLCHESMPTLIPVGLLRTSLGSDSAGCQAQEGRVPSCRGCGTPRIGKVTRRGICHLQGDVQILWEPREGVYKSNWGSLNFSMSWRLKGAADVMVGRGVWSLPGRCCACRGEKTGGIWGSGSCSLGRVVVLAERLEPFLEIK